MSEFTFAGMTMDELERHDIKLQKKFDSMTPEEKRRVTENPMYDRWQAETDAMSDEDDE